MWLDDFPTILSDHKRTSFKNIVETSQLGRVSQINLVDEEDMAFTHSDCQRSIHELHDRWLTRFFRDQSVMSNQICQFHPPVGSDLLNRPVKTTSDLGDTRGFTRPGRSGYEQCVTARLFEIGQDLSQKLFAENVVCISGRDEGV